MILETADIKSVLTNSNTTQKMYINGEWVLSESNQTSKIVNPANGELIGTVTVGSEEDAKKQLRLHERHFMKMDG